MARGKNKHGFSGEETIERDGCVLFWKPPSVFGQWTPSAFSVEGVQYCCAEQFMMAQKARLFGDVATRNKILATQDPRVHKRLGQQVTPFDQQTWDAQRLAIVIAGNVAKFSQNPEMLQQLLQTGDKTLVEASPLDRIWGIGLRADHPDATDPKKWRGQNLLGRALMEVREQLRAG